MDLASIGRKTTKRQTQLRSKVGSAIQLADEMIFTLRRIASEAAAETLDDLGLTAALECQARGVREPHWDSLHCRFTARTACP